MSIVRRPLPDVPSEFGDHFHPVLARVYAARGVGSPTELDHRLENLHSFESLMGVDRAVELLIQAIELDQRILVVGDFDADGATGCAVAVRGLRLLGARQVDFLVPDRFALGLRGLTPEIVAVAEQRQPDLLITVDNGVSSIDGVAAANRAGIPVIVTDHHLAGAELPAAAALVNPNQPDDAFPSKALAGVGVMFYVLVALRAALRLKGWFEKKPHGPQSRPTARSGSARNGGRRGRARLQQSRARVPGTQENSCRVLLSGHSRPVAGGRARRDARGCLRPGVQRWPSPECGPADSPTWASVSSAC